MKKFIEWVSDHRVTVIVSYVAFMVLFYFFGIPKQSFGALVVSFLGVTLFFVVFLYALKKLWFDRK